MLNLAAAVMAGAIVVGAAATILTSLPVGYIVAIASAIGLIWLSRGKAAR